jgi:hypothetical protein
MAEIAAEPLKEELRASAGLLATAYKYDSGCPGMEGRHRFGSSSYNSIADGIYNEETVSLKPTITEGSNDVVFEIPLFGDLVHTFVLCFDSDVGDVDMVFENYKLMGLHEFKPAYVEGMTLKTNNSLARAADYPLSPRSIPLMLRETVDFRNCFIPLLAAMGKVEFQSHRLTLFGFCNMLHAYHCTLHVDYVYLDRGARLELRTGKNLKPAMICNYYSQTLDSDKQYPDACEITVGCNTIGCKHSADLNCEMIFRKTPNMLMEVNTVTGLLITPHTVEAPTRIDFCINGHCLASCSEAENDMAWKKVGLKNPHNNTMLIAFSRNMWEKPEQAAFVDLSRFDKISFMVHGVTTARLEVTALGYRTRQLHMDKHVLFARP